VKAGIKKICLVILKRIKVTMDEVLCQWYEKKAKHICINVCDLFYQQNRVGGFNRLDIIVRYLAIENYYGKNNYGFDMYCKMQEKRMGKEYAKVSVAAFKRLIKSWEDNGYDDESEIECDNNLFLLDGSHRMALALYTGQNIVSCKVYSYRNEVLYGKNWFIENGFTLKEIELILNKNEELFNLYNSSIACILWPPVREEFDEITEKLRLLYPIDEYKNIIFTDETFESAVKEIYAIDDIDEWKINKKIRRMEKESKKEIRLLKIRMDVPGYRLKTLNNNTLSVAGEEIKKMFRNCYKNSVNDYFHDIIIHTGDNYQQSQYIYNLLDKAAMNGDRR